MKKSGLLGIVCSLGLVVAGFMPGISSAVSFDISWAGANGYTMSGAFSYSDSLIGTGVIDENSIDTLMLEAYLNTQLIGTWNLTDGSTTTFNFNFDTNTQQFITGGGSTSTSGQAWNWVGASGLGFVSGNPNQLLSIDGALINDSTILTSSSTLTATLSTVPIPAAAYLFGSGLLWLVGISRRKKA